MHKQEKKKQKRQYDNNNYNKKDVLSQGNRAMPQLFSSV